MKKLLFITSIIASITSFAQQRPHYTQYILNNYIINPALSGIENYADVKLSSRDQWAGLNGAPKTSYFTIHAPLGKKDYRTSSTSFNIPGENPRGRSYWENYTAAEAHHGVGFAMINDRTGSFSRFTAFGSYAYHLGLSPTTNLAAGFSAGITKISIDKSKQDFSGSFDAYDPATGTALEGDIKRVKADMGFGFWLYSRDFFIGLSAQQLVPQKLSFADDAVYFNKGRLIPHIFLSGGYRFLLSDDVNAIPSIMLKYISGSSKYDFQPEMNVKLQYQDLLWLGGSYRYKDGFAAMAGLNVGNTVNVGYSYDITTSPLNSISKGTHEIILGFLLGNKYSQKCPRCY
jgi:type IX secretion system PorP/SprF family membrane protein